VAGALWRRADVLRYGENPHQRAALYIKGKDIDSERAGDGSSGGGIAAAELLHGKAMSYNNYVDADAARRAAYDFAEPCVAIVKHSNPCGIAVGADLAQAHAKAHACDPVSAFGGVIAANGPVTAEMARQVKDVFTEVVIAPGFDPEALDILSASKNIRLLRCAPPVAATTEWRPVTGGMLLQSADRVSEPGDDPANWELKAGPPAAPGQLARRAARRSASGWARSTGWIRPGWRCREPGTGPRARSRRATRTSRSPTAWRSWPRRVCARWPSRAARSATTW
jgi:phosphoribosylaminoimidazolecarboxamide formyltransferase/IMP cyclohydrolase